MRDRLKTIEALRRLAERPGTPEEGRAARAMLERFGGLLSWTPRPFNAADFPPGTIVCYCYWAYPNERGTVCKAPNLKMSRGQWWMRLKFDRLKQPRWVPVTSTLGCHLSTIPFEGDEAETLYRRDLDWKARDAEFRAGLVALGIEIPEELFSIFKTERKDHDQNEIPQTT